MTRPELAEPLFQLGGEGTVQRRWIAPCGRSGPYAVRRPTPANPGRLLVLTCTRPEGHVGAFHQFADDGGQVVAQWDRAGRPDWPPTITTGSTNATDV